jgi:nucleotide-binding universal stress UspA family protein
MAIHSILAATDFSESGNAAVARAARIAGATGAELIIAHVLDPGRHRPSVGPAAPAGPLDEERWSVRRALEALRARLGDEIPTTTLLVEGYPDEQIVKASLSEAANLIVVGASGRTRARRLHLGSVSENVVRASELPVLVNRGDGSSFARILVATDFSEPAERALDIAVAVAAPGAAITVLHVMHVPAALETRPAVLVGDTTLRALEEAARRAGAELVARHRREGIAVGFDCDTGLPRDAILRRLEASHDLVALGSHGRRGMRRFLLGSVASGIVRDAPCSVLVTT